MFAVNIHIIFPCDYGLDGDIHMRSSSREDVCIISFNQGK